MSRSLPCSALRAGLYVQWSGQLQHRQQPWAWRSVCCSFRAAVRASAWETGTAAETAVRRKQSCRGCCTPASAPMPCATPLGVCWRALEGPVGLGSAAAAARVKRSARPPHRRPGSFGCLRASTSAGWLLQRRRGQPAAVLACVDRTGGAGAGSKGGRAGDQAAHTQLVVSPQWWCTDMVTGQGADGVCSLYSQPRRLLSTALLALHAPCELFCVRRVATSWCWDPVDRNAVPPRAHDLGVRSAAAHGVAWVPWRCRCPPGFPPKVGRRLFL